MATDAYNSKIFSDRLTRVIRSSVMAGAVRAGIVTTRDRDYAMSQIKETVVECDRPLYHFTQTVRRRYNPPQVRWETIGAELPDTLALLRSARDIRGGGVVVFEDCLSHLRDDGGDSRIRMQLAEMLSPETNSDGLICLYLEPPEGERRLPAILADQFVRLDVPYPRKDELEYIAREEISIAGQSNGRSADTEEVKLEASRLATGLVGLTRSAARDALRDALAPDPADFVSALESLNARKAEHLSRELKMHVLDTTEVEEPIGLGNLMDYIKQISGKMRIVGPGRAKGIFLLGPAGTGKTMCAKAIGKVAGLSVVEFRIASLMNSLLGGTENAFAKAFATLEALSPVIVFIDEMEKAFGDSSERDGGTMMRCTGALLSWLSDNPYPCFIVATMNNMKRMGEIGLTMTRSERFDASFFVDVPSRDSRKQMLEKWLTGKIADAALTAERFADTTEKFSGADLRSVVKQAIGRAEHLKTDLTEDLIAREVERKRMKAIGLYDEFQELRRWGQMYCEAAGPSDG